VEQSIVLVQYSLAKLDKKKELELSCLVSIKNTTSGDVWQ
jgi:hypothetical protein